MSCDWDVYCKTCHEGHGFQNMNHAESLMWCLVRHSAAIAALQSLMFDDPSWSIEFKAGQWNTIRPSWFAEHLGHELVALDEYGRESTHKPKPL
jgi:hypothetical protein